MRGAGKIHDTGNMSWSFVLVLVVSLSFPITLVAQVFFSASNLPIVVIDTDSVMIPDDPKITAHMGIIDNANGRSNRIGDPFNGYDGNIGIEIRGSSSQSFPKKSYGLETRKKNGDNNNVVILGMPKENDWILHGPFSDKSLIRNALAMKIAQKMGRYAPRTRFCELVINEEYVGVYVMMEKIKRDVNRVPIPSLSFEDSTGDAVTGGYILKFDKTSGGNDVAWYSPIGGDLFQVDYPKKENMSMGQQTYIIDYISRFENALLSESHTDPITGYRPYVDMESFIDFMLVNEISRNVDGYRISSFLYKERDSQGGNIHMGPVWDFNLAFGNANYCDGGRYTGWDLRFNTICPNDPFQISFWWDRFLADPVFYEKAIARWQSLREGAFHTDSLNLMIDEMAAELAGPQVRNFRKWPILDQQIWPNAFIGRTYAAEIAYLKEWLQKRGDWMDANIRSISPYGTDIVPSIIEVFPNPGKDEVTVKIKLTQSGRVGFQVFDLQGRPVYSFESVVEAGFINNFEWDGKDSKGSPLASGMYPYHMYFNGNLFETGKFVKH